MKASFGRLRRFALPKSDAIDIGELFPTAQIEGLARAAKVKLPLFTLNSGSSQILFSEI